MAKVYAGSRTSIDEIRDELVGHERSSPNIVLRFVADGRAGCYLCSQSVSSTEVAETEISDEPLRQRALAAARRAEDQGLEGFCSHALGLVPVLASQQFGAVSARPQRFV